MKKLFSTILIGIMSALAADAPTIVLDVTPEPNLPIAKPLDKTGFFYVRFAAAGDDITRADSIVPGLGLGYRRLAGTGAADISVSGLGIAERHKGGKAFWTAPKVSYLQYFRPDQKQSAYLGGGLAWGGVVQHHQMFYGIIPSLTLGHEFIHKGNILSFMELNVSQPAIAVYKKGAFPGPIAECTVGMGF